MRKACFYLGNFTLLLLAVVGQAFSQENAVTIDIDRAVEVGEMRPFWAYFGYDEPNYTTRENGKKLLSELQEMSPVPVYIRTHNLLTSKGNSPGPDLKWGFTDAYSEDINGKPVYNWVVVDSIIDVIVSRGMKPLMEIGFMPRDLSTRPEPYEHSWSKGGNIWTGWTYPPKDYEKWKNLVYQWVLHTVSRYGMKEVKTWLWEVWNEPDIPYFSGTFEEYCMMYDFAAAGLKKACPECIIGGPHTTSPRNDKANTYLINFIKHCLYEKNHATGEIGSPLQYIGFHAKGNPEYVDGKIRMNMGEQLRDIQRAFETINSFKELKGIPVIIGECDPEGCAACSVERDPKYGYRNGTMYSSYTAASFARIYDLMDDYKVNLQGAVSWSFEFEDQPWFAGFRDLATNGVDKPVLNVFRMFGHMQGNRLKVSTQDGIGYQDIINDGVRKNADIDAMASAVGDDVWVMVWNYHDDILAQKASKAVLNLNHLKGEKVKIDHYRIDENYSNSFEKWKALGSPQQVGATTYDILEKAGKLQLMASPVWKDIKSGQLSLEVEMSHQAVSLIHLKVVK